MMADDNYKFPQRSDLMSLSSLNWQQDQVRVKTANGLRTNRVNSFNLTTNDILSKLPVNLYSLFAI